MKLTLRQLDAITDQLNKRLEREAEAMKARK